MNWQTWEVELKFHVDDVAELEQQLARHGFENQQVEKHEDIYLQHPCRDFRATDEAFRLRSVNGQAFMTYKGPRQPGPVKTREEIELPVANEGPPAAHWLILLERLGFQPVVPVRKVRHIYQSPIVQGRDVLVTIDAVEQLGNFAEVEIVVNDPSKLDDARTRIQRLAERLGLQRVEPLSYLAQLLRQSNG
ncbi:MAG: class IV adenylate cyclase [Pirellulaceae bacterium]|nr:class IV adenylate cyclase [Pirellulaceae bacterium]